VLGLLSSYSLSSAYRYHEELHRSEAVSCLQFGVPCGHKCRVQDAACWVTKNKHLVVQATGQTWNVVALLPAAAGDFHVLATK
jgi:hypothetical protein